MPSLMHLLTSKLELFRLEQRYTRRRNRRSTFVSEAQYVDGEYIYSPTSAKFSTGTGSSDGEEEPREKDGRGKEGKDSVGKRMSRLGLGRKVERAPKVSVREVEGEKS
jgi:hypothetical protein